MDCLNLKYDQQGELVVEDTTSTWSKIAIHTDWIEKIIRKESSLSRTTRIETISTPTTRSTQRPNFGSGPLHSFPPSFSGSSQPRPNSPNSGGGFSTGCFGYCKNGGSCQVEEREPSCSCPDNFSGSTCALAFGEDKIFFSGASTQYNLTQGHCHENAIERMLIKSG